MCIQNALQQHILDITNDGKDVADFFYATMRGATPNAQIHHQFQAAIQLRKLGLHTDDISVRPEPRPELVEGLVEGHTEDEQPTENCELITDNRLVTDLDIINYEVAALIREETNDGYFIADFLARVMRGTSGQGRPISDADRMRAAMELMNRGLGRFGDTRDRRISDSQEELIHSGLSRYIRERTDNGLHAARFLLDVAVRTGTKLLYAPACRRHTRTRATKLGHQLRRCNARGHRRLPRKAGRPGTHRVRRQIAGVA